MLPVISLRRSLLGLLAIVVASCMKAAGNRSLTCSPPKTSRKRVSESLDRKLPFGKRTDAPQHVWPLLTISTVFGASSETNSVVCEVDRAGHGILGREAFGRVSRAHQASVGVTRAVIPT